MFLTPRPLAIAQAAPDNFSVGLPLGSRITSISTQRTPRDQPVPSAFEERAAAAFDGRFDAVDFRDVHSQADNHRASRTRTASRQRNTWIIQFMVNCSP